MTNYPLWAQLLSAISLGVNEANSYIFIATSYLRRGATNF
jgi:hypothetical protein